MSYDVVNNAIKIAKYIVNICNNNEGTHLLDVINFDKFNKYNLNYNIHHNHIIFKQNKVILLNFITVLQLKL